MNYKYSFSFSRQHISPIPEPSSLSKGNFFIKYNTLFVRKRVISELASPYLSSGKLLTSKVIKWRLKSPLFPTVINLEKEGHCHDGWSFDIDYIEKKVCALKG